MTQRLPCCVIHCKRTTGRKEFIEWICGEHWQLIPKAARRAYGRRVGRWRRYYKINDGIAAYRLWQWLKREATEKAVGLR